MSFSGTTVEHASSRQDGLRVLSYNLTLQPRFLHSFQEERIRAFADQVDEFDVLLLQEVFASSVLPHSAQSFLCYQQLLRQLLVKRGFVHVAVPRQPSYLTMAKLSIVTDSGLMIFSRFPIVESGAHTFRTQRRGTFSAAKGCLFAKVTVSPSLSLLLFNVHLRADQASTPPTEISQVTQLKRFVDEIKALHSTCPFIVAGDLNINAITSNAPAGQVDSRYASFLRQMEFGGGSQAQVREVVYSQRGVHPPTRPPLLFFVPASVDLSENASPQRHDYFFFCPQGSRDNVSVVDSRIEKFPSLSRTPYMYLSDHFGISARITATSQILSPAAANAQLQTLSPSRSRSKSWHWFSSGNSESSWMSEWPVMVMIAYGVALVPLLHYALPLLLLAFGVRFILGNQKLADERTFCRVTDETIAGAGCVVPIEGAGSWSPRSALTLWDLWSTALPAFKTRRCLGHIPIDHGVNEPEWLTFAEVDQRVRHLGSGLLSLGLKRGDCVGVISDAHRGALIVEMACVAYGLTTLCLAGTAQAIRSQLDTKQVRVVIASRSATALVLLCRSRCLATVLQLQPIEYEEEKLARDVNVALVRYETIEWQGLSKEAEPCPDSTVPVTLCVNPLSENMDLAPVTHADVLDAVDALEWTKVIPASHLPQVLLSHTPFASVFMRNFIYASMASGHAVAFCEQSKLQPALRHFKPTLMVASPSTFQAAKSQLQLSKRRWTRLYSWLFDRAFSFRSTLIHTHMRDSNTLRRLLFKSFEKQLGGQVRRIVLATSESSVPFGLEEFVAVCYTSCVREVFYSAASGSVVCVDDCPAPRVKASLVPIDARADAMRIGNLHIKRERRGQSPTTETLEVAAVWRTDRTLQLIGPTDSILWPVDYFYSCALDLEREYLQQCKYISNIFVTCAPLHPLVAIVSPNRDVLEAEWKSQQRGKGSAPLGDRTLQLHELILFATPIIAESLESIAMRCRFHPTQFIKLVHVHPHAFADHNDFFTPHGRQRRSRLSDYFRRCITKMYASSGEGDESLRGQIEPTSPVLRTPTMAREPELQLPIRAPVAADIGGTFAKVVYIRPPGEQSLPLYCERDSVAELEALVPRNLTCFRNEDSCTSPQAGGLCFVKLLSVHVPDFVRYLHEAHIPEMYKPEDLASVRATGGGAIKYAALVEKELGVRLNHVKEMDSIVAGLNALLQYAPHCIFTFDPDHGIVLPHRLGLGSSFPFLVVNIGSGVSIIKVLDQEGRYERVGGSPIGGATFWGLVRTMTSIKTWDEVLEITRIDGPGDNTNVDLLVGDIYGFNATDLPQMLSVDTVASTFGKFGTDRFLHQAAVHQRRLSNLSEMTEALADDNEDGVHASSVGGSTGVAGSGQSSADSGPAASSLDIVRSLLIMIANNVTQLAYLHSQTQSAHHVFFTGGFVRENPIVWRQITRSLMYWSKGQMAAHFLCHDGYLGAIGAITMLK